MELASLAQLERSHRRHDEVMAGLLEAARRFAAGRPETEDLDRVHEAIAYFERAVTRHFLDEEGSVFPRLSTRRPELAAQLAALSAEHPEQIAMQGEVAEAAKQLDGEARPAAGKALLDAATRLADAHRSHVAREDEIFRHAHEALTREDDHEIVSEMETRRDRDRGNRDGRRSAGGGRRGGGGGVGRRRANGQRAAAARATIAKPAKPAARASARKPTVKVTASRKRVTTTTAKKATAKNATAKKATAKKAAAEKATAKKPPATKATTRARTLAKTAAKKPGTRTRPLAKTATKKVAKPAPRPARSARKPARKSSARTRR